MKQNGNRWPSRRGAVALAFCLTGLAGIGQPAVAADTKTETVYQGRFDKLKVDDISGHLQLAIWCRDQQAFDLLRRECNHILSVDPRNQQAKLLLELAERELQASSSDTDATSKPAATEKKKSAAGVVLLTDEQIQIIRRTVLRLEYDQPEKVRVRFRNDVLERFWKALAARENLTRRDRPSFFKLPPIRKAQEILSYVRYREYDPDLATDVEVLTDPEVMKTFRTRVWPIIESRCATAACHGGKQAAGIAFVTTRRTSDATVYTNYMILHEYQRDDKYLINRDKPDESLLLTYGSPAEAVKPDLRHPVEIPPVFRKGNQTAYVRIRDWLEKLPPPRPDYGFSLEHTKK